MTEVARALTSFWSSFGIPAYPEDSVPYEDEGDNLTMLPYITYQLIQPEWSANATYQARVWYWSESLAPVLAKVDEIKSAIGTGVLLPAGAGYVCIRPGDPYVQMQPAEDWRLRIAYINLQINAYKQ